MSRRHSGAKVVLAFLVLEIMLIMYVDQPLSNYLRDLDRSAPSLINVFRGYTDYAKSVWYLVPSGIAILICAFVARQRGSEKMVPERAMDIGQKLVTFFCTVAIAGITTDIIKPLLGRARPIAFIRENAYGFHPFTFSPIWNSMPSGHATSAFAVAGALCFLFPRMRLAWLVWAILMSLSRVMVNAHYLSDVVAGALVGYGTAWLVHRWFKTKPAHTILRFVFPINL